MSLIEQHLQQFTAINQKIDQVSEQVVKVTNSNQEMTHALRSDIEVHTKQLQDQNAAYQNHCDSQITNLGQNVLRAMEEIALMRQDISNLTKFMMKDLSNRHSPSSEPKRRKQRVKHDMFDDLMSGVLLNDTSIPEDDIMGDDHESDDDNSANLMSLPASQKLDHIFQQHVHNSDYSSAVESPLPPSPTKPDATTQFPNISTSISSRLFPVATKLDTVFQRQEYQSAARSAAAKSPLPPSPPKPLVTTQLADVPTQHAPTSDISSVREVSITTGSTDDFLQATPSPLAQTQLSNLKKTQNSIQRYFSSAPLNPRNNKTTDSAGANNK